MSITYGTWRCLWNCCCDHVVTPCESHVASRGPLADIVAPISMSDQVRSSYILNAVLVKQNITHCSITYAVTDWPTDLLFLTDYKLFVCPTQWINSRLFKNCEGYKTRPSYRTCKTILYLLNTIFNENCVSFLWMCFFELVTLFRVPYTSQLKASYSKSVSNCSPFSMDVHQ